MKLNEGKCIDNRMKLIDRTKLNEDKCHLMIFGGKSNEVSVKIGEANAKESKEEKPLETIFDQTLEF